jgi:hypothetical protein
MSIRRQEDLKMRRILPFGQARLTLAALTLMLVAGTLASAPPQQGSAPVQQPARQFAVNPMEVPLRLIADAHQSYERITDYSCLFIKREVLNRQLQPENLIAMKVRTQPFSVYMHWYSPSNLAGQEVCYVTGRNNGMMRVHSTRLLAPSGFMSMAPNDPRALENSRHTINEAGIGHLIERLAHSWQIENQLNRTQVQVAEYEYDKKRCTRVETVHPSSGVRQTQFYRTVVYFDQGTHLPIRIENYDWPRTPGDRTGTLVECYSYAELRLNIGISEQTFNH